MNVLLLTKKSVMQAYCANKLAEKDILSHLIIEEADKRPNIIYLTINRLVKLLMLITNPINLIAKIKFFFSREKFFGNEQFHNLRILNSDSVSFSKKLKINYVQNISDTKVIEIIKKINPEIIFVFGTTMISKKVLDTIKCPMINQHAGWSPDYRGEGIVSSISKKDFKKIGITVHFLDEKSDAGNIIYQESINIDEQDNFYSIHLKIIKKGTDFFEKVFIDFKENNINSIKQDLKLGKLYGRKFFKLNPGVYDLAWNKLSEFKKLLK